MKRRILPISILVLILAGCDSKNPGVIEWRPVEAYHETVDKKQALELAKKYFANNAQGVAVAFQQDDSADLSHIEYDIVSEGDGYKLTGRYIALYHSTGSLNGFPGGYFVLGISKDGTVKTIHAGE
ncbi:MAG: hypothetical protein ACYSUY_06060 [Planctomycetota bacterium]|jgi:hypothetical protein